MDGALSQLIIEWKICGGTQVTLEAAANALQTQLSEAAERRITVQLVQKVVARQYNMSVQQLLERLVATGQETGIQVAAYLDGKLVVDAWAGVADPERGRPIDRDTLINVWSAGKAVAATTVHALVERGALGYLLLTTRP